MGYLEIVKVCGIFALVAAIFVAGYNYGYTFEHNKVLELQKAIELSNLKSVELLQQETLKVVEAENLARLKNEELENARKQEIATVNAYHDKLASVRLFDRRNKTSCSNTLSESNDSRINKEDGKNGTELSEELTQFLRTESDRADKAAIDKNLLLDFVKNNCGIKEKK